MIGRTKTKPKSKFIPVEILTQRETILIHSPQEATQTKKISLEQLELFVIKSDRNTKSQRS
jgi:hypothetical protein